MKFDELESQLRDINCSNEAIALAINSGKRTLDFPRKDEKQSLEDGVVIAARLYDMFHGLTGRNILDIGCGSPEQQITYHTQTDGFPTDIARTLAFAGANVDGIDIGRSFSKQPYNHIVADLTRQRIADVVPNGRNYDCAISTWFFDSPCLKFDCTNGYDKGKIVFAKDICTQVYDLLKPNGIFIIGQSDLIAKMEEHPENLVRKEGESHEEWGERFVHDHTTQHEILKLSRFRKMPGELPAVITSGDLKDYPKAWWGLSFWQKQEEK